MKRIIKKFSKLALVLGVFVICNSCISKTVDVAAEISADDVCDCLKNADSWEKSMECVKGITELEADKLRKNCKYWPEYEGDE